MIPPPVTPHPVLPSGSGVGTERPAPAAEWSWEWQEEQDRILNARFRAGICWACSHFAHTPDGCDTKPIRFGLIREDKCACGVGGE